jgi:protein gp37
MGATKIEWTEKVWNPVTGCTKISPGCAHCYAERIAKRLLAMGQPRYRNGFRLTLHPDVVEAPLHWRRPRMIFVNSMSDLFHWDVPKEFIRRCFDVMVRASQHTFQILTKRPALAAELASRLPWPENVWMGTSVEAAEYTTRIRRLVSIPAAVRFLSLEPLLGPMPNLPLGGVDWVIAGGESGPDARPCHPDWVRSIRDQCQAAGVPFFFKQWGDNAGSGNSAADQYEAARTGDQKGGRMLDGREWNEYPHKERSDDHAR